MNMVAVLSLVAIPGQVIWAYLIGGAVLAIGLAAMFYRGDWQAARGAERVVVLGPLFYAAPLAAFGGEHFTLTQTIAAMVPSWLPWHLFWAYFVGACFIAGALSLVTRVQARHAAGLLGLTFFLFVVLMDAPGWAHAPHDRFALALMLRELSFSGGALALAVSLCPHAREGGAKIQAIVARYFIAVPVVVYSVEQFLHADHVPAVPLRLLTPTWIFGHALWTYLAAAAFAVTGVLLLAGKRTREAATWLGITVLFVEVVVYIPIAVAQRATLVGFNYLGDTLMFAGAALLLAGAMPREERTPSGREARSQAASQPNVAG